MDTSGVVQFADFDLTLTDRDLDDFLSFMEHQTTGAEYGDSMPQLPDVAMDFPGLQLQPHSGSPSRSEGSDSAGVGASGAAGTTSNSAQRPALAASDGSLTSAAMSSPAHEASVCGAGSSGNTAQQQQQRQRQRQQQGNSSKQQQLSPAAAAASPTDISSQQMQQPPLPPLQQPLPVKPELSQQQQQQEPVQFAAASSLPAVLVGSAALPTATTLAGTLAGPVDSTTALMMSCPTTMDAGGYSLQPMQWHSSSAITAAVAAVSAAQVQQPLPQLMFMQAPGVPSMLQQSGQPQLSSLMQPSPVAMNQQIAAFAGLASPTGDPSCSTAAAMERQTSGGRASRQLQGLVASPSMQARAGACGYGDTAANGSGKPQVSHSTVEKQRRDRLNSLIDELSDMVPPADPKYGADTNSVRRPKHVVLADTINLLKAMQTKLQIEEAEICTLKQHAAAVGAMAAQHQVGHAAVPEAADAMMQAAAAAGASPERDTLCHGGYGDACEGMPVELPSAPECGANSTGVLVEQGIGCLYVKVNCKDRKGLLSDVVSALKAFPVVICTAAITTTKDGKVHDVFEVRMEDGSVSAEDIQCAVQQALFAAAARSKRLRREDSAGLMPG